MSLRALATHALEMSENDGVNPPIDRAGHNTETGPADWVYRLSATYNLDRMTLQIIGRGVSDGVYDNTWIECQTNCPESTADNRTISDNSLSGAFYVDTYFAYRLPFGDSTSQFFFKVNNLFDKDPEPVGRGPGDSSNVEPGINRALYDYLGRSFRIGVRMEF